MLAPAGAKLLLAGAGPAPWSATGPTRVATGPDADAGPLTAIDGRHLAAADPFPAAPPGMVGRSCHDAAELRAAAAEGADYATLSPIFRPISKPGYGPPLGLSRLADLCAGAGLPVYALGGIETAARRRRAGPPARPGSP